MTTSGTFAVTPLSPVSCDAVVCRQVGILWATVIVKATFQLVHGEAARLVAPLPLVRRDQVGAAGSSLAAARETAPHVPSAGVVLTGHAHAPDGRAVPSMSVRLGISRERPVIDKTLHVFGSRAVASPSAVMPFQKMPLVYERAFGGAGVWENPVGTGGPGSRALPNIVDPRDARRPAGFGPIAGAWAPRRALLGGADPSVLEQAVFEPPRGFDWRHFQAAPADQQLDAFRGDEWIVLDGMHPSLPRVQARLPQVKAQARRGSGGAAEQAVELRADMLVIDADRLVASLVWRGRFAVESLDALRSVRVLAGIEMPGRPIEWPPAARTATGAVAGQSAAAQIETQAVNLAAILGGSLPFSADRESALPPSSPKAAAPSLSTGTAMVDVRKILEGAVPFQEAAATAALPAFVPETKGAATATVMELPAFNPPAVPFAPADASRPPPESLPSPAGQKATPMSTGTTDINLAEVLKSVMPYRGAAASAPVPVVTPAPPPAVVAPPAAPPPVVAPPPAAVAPPAAPPPVAAPPPAVVEPPDSAARAEAPPAAAPPASLAPVVTRPVSVVPPAPQPPAAPSSAPAAPPVLAPAPAPVATPPAAMAPLAPLGALPDTSAVRAAVLERLAAGQSLDGLKLSGADLHEIDFKGASLIGLDFQRAKLVRAKLGETRLADARLSGADLTGADLSGADLGRADLSRAVLDGARFNGAVLIGARLCDARGKGACFDGARLAQADLQGAELHEAAMLDIDAPASTWDKASLEGSRLLGAKLRGASFQRATLDKVCLSQADLTSANFHRATGTAVDFRAARLEAADLRQAQLPGATFDDAELRDVSATKADLSGARFFRAELVSANFRAAKLSGADFTHAKLDGADLRDTELTGIKIDPAVAKAAKIRLPRPQ